MKTLLSISLNWLFLSLEYTSSLWEGDLDRSDQLVEMRKVAGVWNLQSISSALRNIVFGDHSLMHIGHNSHGNCFPSPQIARIHLSTTPTHPWQTSSSSFLFFLIIKKWNKMNLLPRMHPWPWNPPSLHLTSHVSFLIQKSNKKIWNPMGVLWSGGCLGYWGRDSSGRGYCDQPNNEWSPNPCFAN
jgi:hypothetical protein